MAARTRKSKRSRTVNRRSGTTQRPDAAAKSLTADGQKLVTLEGVPWEMRSVMNSYGFTYRSGIGWCAVDDGSTEFDPEILARYRAPQYSLGAKYEDITAGVSFSAAPDTGTGSITLRDDQYEDVEHMLITKGNGCPVFLNSNDTGLGKTAATIAAIKSMPKVREVLIVSPLAIMSGWRRHLQLMGDGGKSWTIINYDKLAQLLTVPQSARDAKSARAKNNAVARDGTSLFAWDVIVFDESHYLSNWKAQRTQLAERLLAGKPRTATKPFAIDLSATYARDPSKMMYLYRGLYWLLDETVPEKITATEFSRKLDKLGVVGTKADKFGALQWNRALDRSDSISRISDIIFENDYSFGVNRENPEEQPRELRMVELSYDERASYDKAWTEFLAEQFGDATGEKDPQQYLAKMTRFRQKAGILKAPYVARAIKETLAEDDVQIIVSCQFTDTIGVIEEELGSSVPYVTITGQNTAAERTASNDAFQRGEAKVVLWTGKEGVNFQANDPLVPGASTVPRVTYVAEPRWPALDIIQIEGRGTRNGEVAPAFYFCVSDSIEERVIEVVVNSTGNTFAMKGAKERERMIDAFLVEVETATGKRPDPQTVGNVVF